MNANRDKIFFVSDAHLGAVVKGGENREDTLVAFLQWIEPQASQLFILGDLFEFWFEYKYLVPKGHIRLLSRLAEMARSGVALHYVAGNHDFALGAFLQDEIGMTLHWKPLETELQGKNIFIAHGDGLNKRDIGYRALKPILRSRLNQALYRLLPADWAIGFARLCAGASRTADISRRHARVVKAYRAIAQELTNRGFEVVVLGHTHFPELLFLGKGYYANTGGWLSKRPYVVLEDGIPKLEFFAMPGESA